MVLHVNMISFPKNVCSIIFSLLEKLYILLCNLFVQNILEYTTRRLRLYLIVIYDVIYEKGNFLLRQLIFSFSKAPPIILHTPRSLDHSACEGSDLVGPLGQPRTWDLGPGTSDLAYTVKKASQKSDADNVGAEPNDVGVGNFLPQRRLVLLHRCPHRD